MRKPPLRQGQDGPRETARTERSTGTSEEEEEGWKAKSKDAARQEPGIVDAVALVDVDVVVAGINRVPEEEEESGQLQA